jgi:hypothetical protein
MSSYQTDLGRQLRRTELRRAASRDGFTAGAFLALDQEELLQRASLDDVNSHGNTVKRRLVLTALRSTGATLEQIAEAWGTDVPALDAAMRTPLLDRDGTAAAIEKQVEADVPVTREPDRTQPVLSSPDAYWGGAARAWKRAEEADRA